MFDIQVKRIHEYKRQLLNVMGIIWRYDQVGEMEWGAARRSVVVCWWTASSSTTARCPMPFGHDW